MHTNLIPICNFFDKVAYSYAALISLRFSGRALFLYDLHLGYSFLPQITIVLYCASHKGQFYYTFTL